MTTRYPTVLAASLSLAVAAACVSSEESPTSGPLLMSWAAPDTGYGKGEPELFGNVYENGVHSTRTNLTIAITPLDEETRGRLKGRWLGTMWVNPNPEGPNAYPKGWAYGWFDPRGANNCGGMANYEAGNNAGRAYEIHRVDATTPPDTSLPEGHCIRPGRYRIELSGQGIERGFDFEYVGVRALSPEPSQITAVYIPDPALGDSLIIEPDQYSTGDTYTDHVVHFDLVTTSGAPTPAIRLQNVHTNLFSGSFVAQQFPAGNENDWFRFSSHTSTGITWSGSVQGRALAAYHWDHGHPGAPVPYFFDDRSARRLLRVHRFADIPESRTVYVGLQLMQPNNLPDPLPIVRDSIQFTRLSPVACAAFEVTSTWRMTDQVVNAACWTRGANIRYRWRFESGGPWTAYSTDTLFNFVGHPTAGNPLVTVEARNTSSGLSSFSQYPFTVAANGIALSGQVFVTDKATNLYTSDTAGMWYERFEWDTQWQQEPIGERNWMTRIWYAGEYSVSLRQEHVFDSALARGRLDITVCNPCEGGLIASAVAPASSEDWGLFGGGPWLSWGSASALRLYDLVGSHEVANRFTDIGWLESDSGQATATGAGSFLSWRRRPTSDANARAYDFTIAASPSPFTFGLALDPDLGRNAADDAAGFDENRGMVYVWDDNRAVGYLLRDETGRNALSGVTQYGLRRRSPRLARDVWAAQRGTQTRLLPGRSDVQLLLSTLPRPGVASWTFLMVRGVSVAELQRRADDAVAQLTSR